MAQAICIVLALASTVIGVAVFARGIREIVRVLKVGKATSGRKSHGWRRTWLTLAEVVGHGRMGRKPVVAAAHWCVMVSFPVLVLTLPAAYGQLFDPEFSLPYLGHFIPLEWLTEFFAWSGLIGIVVLTIIRIVKGGKRKSSRFYGSSFWQAYYVEATIFGVVLAVILLRGLDYALAAQDPATAGYATAWHFPLTQWFGQSWVGVDRSTLETAVIVLSAVKIVVSMAWFVTVGLLPKMGIAWHRFLAFVNIWFKRADDDGSLTLASKALGPLEPLRVDGEAFDIEHADDLPDDAVLGVAAIEDFTWKGLLDFATCTECGRCQEQCPAWNTDKPLSPKLLVLALRDQAFAKPADGTPLVPDVIDSDVLWACTTCGACVEQCPVDIEHVDHIIDIRRNQVLMESAFPSELGGAFKKMESKGNPWGLQPRARMDWAKGLDFDIPVVGADVEDLADIDYLFWVGCAGAYEDRAKRTTRAVAELLHMADVSFAVLGDGETCTGDPARRAGNEVLFQMLAKQNIETLTEVKARSIVVTCAHCYNTIAREYPQLGGSYKVVHHTELLNRLVRAGRLTPVVNPAEGTVTYHDPCYLGRHNDIYEPPRELVGATGVTVTELPRSRQTSFCCGAGGARMWMEEKIGERINANRAAEIIASGAQTVATGCPFCHTMLADGLAKAEEPVAVVDVAELLLGSVKRP